MSTEPTDISDTNENQHILSGGINVTLNANYLDLPEGEEIAIAADCHTLLLDDMELDATEWDCSSLLDLNGGSGVTDHSVECLADLAMTEGVNNVVSPTQADKTPLISSDSIEGPMKPAELTDEHNVVCDKSSKGEAETNQCIESTNSDFVKQVIDVGSNPFFALEDENGEFNDWLESLPYGSNCFKSKDKSIAMSKSAANPAMREVIDITSHDERYVTTGAIRSPPLATHLPSRQPTFDPAVINASPTQMSNAELATPRQPTQTRKNHVATFVNTHNPNPNPYFRRRSISTPPENTGHGTVFHRRTLTGATSHNVRRFLGHPPPSCSAPMHGTAPSFGYVASFISQSSPYGHQTPISASGNNTPILHMSPGPQPQRTSPTKDSRSHPYHPVCDNRQRQTILPASGQRAPNQRAPERTPDAPKRKYTPRQTQRNEDLGATFFAEEYQTHCEQLLGMARYSMRVWQDAVIMDADCDPRQRA
jgi:hypothetical protein